MSNSLGRLFTVTSFGESHGAGVGVVIDGCPAGLPLSEADLQPDLDRRSPGRSEVSSERREPDRAEILSGVFKGRTTGAPLCCMVRNADADSSKYDTLNLTPRPGHADFTSFVKYGGFGDYRGGGRFSGRITAGWVMAGSVAKKLLAPLGVEVNAYTIEIAGIKAAPLEPGKPVRFEPNAVSCPDPAAAAKMERAIVEARSGGDSVGGIIEAVAHGVPTGWGEPVAGTLDGEIARAFFAIPSVKGVEFGAGFRAARLPGSKNNDPFIIETGKVKTLTNNAGGILGGLSNGMPVIARVAIKPTPSIARQQRTVNLETMAETTLRMEGRHDPCIVPRAVVVVEAMMAMVLCDFARQAGALPEIIK